MKAIIVDDTRLARQELQFLLKNHKDVQVIDEAENADEAKKKIEELKAGQDEKVVQNITALFDRVYEKKGTKKIPTFD